MASMASAATVAEVLAPRVVAAGHKHIPAPKSGGSYPAFLISIPAVVVSHAHQQAKSLNFQHASSYHYRWRTKRDLLLLSRAARAMSATLKGKNGGEFPKSTYAKLAHAASSCPWVRPDVNNDIVEMISRDTISSANGSNNGWRAEMYKSARRLDWFLKECIDLYNQAVVSSGEGDSKDKEEASPVIKGWQEFCRQADTEGLIDFIFQSTDGKYPKSSETSSKKRLLDADNNSALPADPTKRAACLGQYFASDDNAAAVVASAIALAANNGKGDDIDLRNVVFVEPSCGDGRILERLLKDCSYPDRASMIPYCVLGYDIDGTAAEACQERIALTRNNDKNHSSFLPPVAIGQADFLASTRERLLHDVCEARKGLDYCLPVDDVRFVFLGGPPYSLGPLRDGINQERGLDLPRKFIRRCIVDLKCDAISFLLPDRCEKDADRIELPGWTCTTNKAADSSFDFQGKTVTQPSILQCWLRKQYLY